MTEALDAVRDSSRRPDEGGCPASERHVPVLLAECLDMLAPAIEGPGAVLVDGTLGMGGHTEGALDRFPELTVIGIDRDPQAIALASERLERFGDRFRAVHTTYDRIDEAVAEQCGPGARIDGVLMDLGVSSLQLDEAERGFAYSKDAPLDMRMDATSGPSAADLLATASEAWPSTMSSPSWSGPCPVLWRACVSEDDWSLSPTRAWRIGSSRTCCGADQPAPPLPDCRSSPTIWPPVCDYSPRARTRPTELNKTTTPDLHPCDCAERNSSPNGRISHECSNR